MKDKMMRVTSGVLDKLKVLKGVIGNAPYSDIIGDLVHKELLKHTAFTKDGYLPIGTVVRDMDGIDLVIKSVTQDKVIFNDFSYVINGGGACWKLTKLGDTVAEHNERVPG